MRPRRSPALLLPFLQLLLALSLASVAPPSAFAADLEFDRDSAESNPETTSSLWVADRHVLRRPRRALLESRSDAEEEEECRGSRFQIIVHFDAYPEDFAMRLRNDVTNKTVWTFDDHKYPSSRYQHATVSAGVCLPKDWCWVLTVFDKNGDGMVGNEMTYPNKGGGFRLLFNGLTVNYYTGTYNGCYKSMWFRFGEWCSAQEAFGLEDPGEVGCGNFTVGRAPDDGWFPGDLYQVGTEAPATSMASSSPSSVPTASTTLAPVRVAPTDRPASTSWPVPDPPVGTAAAPASPPPNDDPTQAPSDVVVGPTPPPFPISSSVPTAIPTVVGPVVAPKPPLAPPVNPVFCHFRYCPHNRR